MQQLKAQRVGGEACEACEAWAPAGVVCVYGLSKRFLGVQGHIDLEIVVLKNKSVIHRCEVCFESHVAA